MYTQPDEGGEEEEEAAVAAVVVVVSGRKWGGREGGREGRSFPSFSAIPREGRGGGTESFFFFVRWRIEEGPSIPPSLHVLRRRRRW